MQRSNFRGIADLSDEILVIIFELVLTDNKYNATLSRVCSRWTRLIYRFVYVNGFIMQDSNPEISRLLLPLVSSIENSEFASILTLSTSTEIMERYRVTLHARTFTYMVMRLGLATDVVGDSSRMIVTYTNVRFGKLFKDLEEKQKQSVLGVFIVDFITRMVNFTRVRLQIILETEFIKHLDPNCLINRRLSILERDSSIHLFAAMVQTVLTDIHKDIDIYLQTLFVGVRITAPFRARIESLINAI